MLILKPKDTRIKNAITLLHILLKQDGISRVELSRITGLTKTTVSSIIKEFLAAGIVEESPTKPNGNVGKTPISLHIKKNAVYTLGVHLGRHNIKTVLMDASMKVLMESNGLSYKKNDPDSVLEKLYLDINHIMEKAEKHGIKVGVIGIGIPGPLDPETGVIKCPPKFEGWINIPLGEIIQKKYKLPVWIENDANVAALAEKWHGGAKYLKNFVYILVNEGIGAGFVINDELYQGTHDYVGEIGHSLFYVHGQFKYLEDLYGVDVLTSQIKSCGLNAHSIEDVANLLKADNKIVYSIVRDSAKWLSIVVLNVIHLLNPQAVFIGGTMAALGNYLIQPVKEIVSQYLFGDQETDVKLSEISDNAVAIGAGIYATAKWLEAKSIEHVHH